VRCEVWGVLNATPDSFSDGGRFLDAEHAVAHALSMLADGADLIDVGGESSRPAGRTYGAGAPSVLPDEEVRRVVPVIERLVDRGARVSVDTVKGTVARRAIEAGASVVNDVSGGSDPELLRAVAEGGVDLVLMHNRGRGEISADNTAYRDVVAEVIEELEVRVRQAVRAGVSRERIWLDPGVGFAKTARQSVVVVSRMADFVATGHRIVVGTSKKSFIGETAPRPDGEIPPPDERVGGTAATVAASVLFGAHAVRVHDVATMRQAVLVSEAMRGAA
jgi:dihydropteroate synthase